jgi:hypothetical protein
LRSCAPFFKAVIAFTAKQPNNRIQLAQKLTTTGQTKLPTGLFSAISVASLG